MSVKMTSWMAALAGGVSLLTPVAAYPQVALTGAIQFSTDANGAFYGNQSWNTLGGDGAWNLWLARNPDASLPINGPTDAESSINLPLQAGHRYGFYMFGAPDTSISRNGLNLFFNGNVTNPGISVFGATNSALFVPDSSSGTRTLAGAPVKGSGRTSYSTGSEVVVLTGYQWNAPATPPGDVCQAFTFTPGGGASFSGWLTLEVFAEAGLTVNRQSGPPGTELGMAGSGFEAGETVMLYAGQIGSRPIGSAVADGSGSFSVTVNVPPHPYGQLELFALGGSSGRLGVAGFLVTSALAAIPGVVPPGGTAAIDGLGFGAGETVRVFWNHPRATLGTAVTNSLGSFRLKITVPENAPPGINAIVGIGQSGTAIAVGEIRIQ